VKNINQGHMEEFRREGYIPTKVWEEEYEKNSLLIGKYYSTSR
jgi:hypothetical protein